MQNNKNIEGVKTNIEKERKLIERIEKLEIGILLLINQLRGVKEIPEILLENVEKILLNKGE